MTAVARLEQRAEAARSIEPQPPIVVSHEWPNPLGEEAFHGLTGEIVRAIAPQSESDEAAILLQVLVSFGALVGRGPHIRVEGDQHHANLFGLVVGDTSKARKGTSWSRVREIFSHVDPINTGIPDIHWPKVVEGLSSGEGLKWAVRDRITKSEANGATVADVEIDPGVNDKRILVVESEFAQVLRQCARAGNTLSSTIRTAWDTGKLQTLTKNDPIVATGAHICIVGHITSDELRAELTQTDSANGFANRFLFMCAKRSKSLPFGGEPLSQELLSQFATRLAKAAATARSRLEGVQMTPAAKAIWSATYEQLSDGKPGLFGAVTARAEAQCLRLALAYALLDGAAQIDKQHILAAMAVWERAEASAKCIFGHSLGDAMADAIDRELRNSQDGLTRTDISRLFNRHQSAERIGVALDLLRKKGLAVYEIQQTGGAPREIWRCAK